MTEKIKTIEKEINIITQIEFRNQLYNNKDFVKDLGFENKILFSSTTSLDKKKKILQSLVLCKEIGAYRIIEEFHKSCKEKDLKEWAYLALLYSEIIIENQLSNDKRVLISSGLGGKNEKLRYSIVFKKKNKTEFSDIEQKTIIDDVKYFFTKFEAELESIEFKNELIFIKMLYPFEKDFFDVAKLIISSVNMLIPELLDSYYFSTNIKEFTLSEMKKHLKK